MYFIQLVFLYDVELTVNSKFLRIATLDPILYRISMMAMKFLDLTHPHDLTKLIQKLAFQLIISLKIQQVTMPP